MTPTTDLRRAVSSGWATVRQRLPSQALVSTQHHEVVPNMARFQAPAAEPPAILRGMKRVAWVLFALAACGDNVEGIPDQILPESVYAARCAMPRSGIDPTTSAPYADVKGTVLDEKLWLRSWIDDLYLWYREVPAVDITAYNDPVAYFDQLKT